MNIYHHLKKSVFCLTLILTTSAAIADDSSLNPNSQQVQPGDTIKATSIPSNLFLRRQNDPDDLIWDRVPIYGTKLSIAPPVHQSATLRFNDDATVMQNLYFQIARSNERLFVRFNWRDKTEDRKSTVEEFRDAVAIQYALNGEDTSYMMGSGHDKPVNIWYWKADTNTVENLAAGGYGSTTTLENQNVTGTGDYIVSTRERDNEWHVVMSRPLEASNEHDVDFSNGQVPIAFALWQGSKEERNGNKRVSHTWIMLDTGASDAAKKAKPEKTEKKKCGWLWFWQSDDDC